MKIKNLLLSISLFFLTTSFGFAKEEVNLSPEGCVQIAIIIGQVTESRDIGVPLQTHLKEIHGIQGVPEQVILLLSQEVKKVYKIYANKGPEANAERFFNECFAQQGNINRLLDINA